MPRKEVDNLSESAAEIVDQYSELLLSSIEGVLAEHRETMEDALSSPTKARRVPIAIEQAITEVIRSDWHTAIDEIVGDADDDDEDDEDEEEDDEDEAEEEEAYADDDAEDEY